MSDPLKPFREAWIAALAGCGAFLLSALIVSIPDLPFLDRVPALVRVGLWSFGAFGFSTATIAWIVSGVLVRDGVRKFRED